MFFIKVAGRAGKVDAEIDLLHQLRNLYLKESGIEELGDRNAARLRELEEM